MRKAKHSTVFPKFLLKNKVAINTLLFLLHMRYSKRLSKRMPQVASCFPLDGTHLVAVRGLSNQKFQPECVNEVSLTERRS